MGGERGVLLLQSSGVGNGINMLALDIECSLLALVTIRGEWGEFNPGQEPMGAILASAPRKLRPDGSPRRAWRRPARAAPGHSRVGDQGSRGQPHAPVVRAN